MKNYDRKYVAGYIKEIQLELVELADMWFDGENHVKITKAVEILSEVKNDVLVGINNKT
jgi:hypothetical protein